MGNEIYWNGSLLFTGYVAFYGTYFAVRSWRRHFLLRRAPLRPIAATTSANVVAIEGRIVAHDVLTAPLSGVAAVYYKAQIGESFGLGASRREWIHQIEQATVPFELDDGSGVRAWITLDSKKLDLTCRQGTFDSASAAALRMAQRKWPGAVTAAGKDFTEDLLAVGDVVLVLGAARTVGDGGDEYRSETRRLVVGAAVDSTAPLMVQIGSARELLAQPTRQAWIATVVAILSTLAFAAVGLRSLLIALK